MAGFVPGTIGFLTGFALFYWFRVDSGPGFGQVEDELVSVVPI